jgi:hypothetical protein
MRTNIPGRTARAVMAVAAAVLAAASPAAGQDASSGLAVTAELEKQEFALGEPVYLIVRLHNRGTREVRLPNVLQEVNGFLHVHVRGPQGAPRVYVPLAQADDEGVLTLAAGASASSVVPVFFGAAGWTFPAPGDYSLVTAITVPGSAEPIRSQPTRLQVRPDPAGARLVGRTRGGFEAGRFLLWQSGDHLTAGRALLDSIAREAPRSPVAQHALYVEGRANSRSFSDFRAQRVRQPEPRRALETLGRADERALPRYVLIQKRLAEASSYIQLREAGPARARLAQARELIATDPAFAPLAAQVQRLEGALGNLR